MGEVTLKVPAEQVAGLRYVFNFEFEHACDKRDANQLRELIAFGDALGWEDGDQASSEITPPDGLLDKLVTHAWEAGNEMMADVYSHRANPKRPVLTDADGDERMARSLIALAEHFRREEVGV